MSHYDEEYNKAIQLAAQGLRNERKQEGDEHIKTTQDAEAYINKMKSDYITGFKTEEELLASLNEHSAHADLISDPWNPMYSPDEDFSNILDSIRVTSNNEYVRGLLDDVLAYGDIDSCSRDVLLTIKKELLK